LKSSEPVKSVVPSSPVSLMKTLPRGRGTHIRVVQNFDVEIKTGRPFSRLQRSARDDLSGNLLGVEDSSTWTERYCSFLRLLKQNPAFGTVPHGGTEVAEDVSVRVQNQNQSVVCSRHRRSESLFALKPSRLPRQWRENCFFFFAVPGRYPECPKWFATRKSECSWCSFMPSGNNLMSIQTVTRLLRKLPFTGMQRNISGRLRQIPKKSAILLHIAPRLFRSLWKSVSCLTDWKSVSFVVCLVWQSTCMSAHLPSWTSPVRSEFTGSSLVIFAIPYQPKFSSNSGKDDQPDSCNDISFDSS
jgi:hypothetical protein